MAEETCHILLSGGGEEVTVFEDKGEMEAMRTARESAQGRADVRSMEDVEYVPAGYEDDGGPPESFEEAEHRGMYQAGPDSTDGPADGEE